MKQCKVCERPMSDKECGDELPEERVCDQCAALPVVKGTCVSCCDDDAPLVNGIRNGTTFEGKVVTTGVCVKCVRRIAVVHSYMTAIAMPGYSIKAGDTLRVWDWRGCQYYDAVATTDEVQDGEVLMVGTRVDEQVHYATWCAELGRWEDGDI